MIRVLSREPERSMLGLVASQCLSRAHDESSASQLPGAAALICPESTYFSREVAREVTQPEWPSRVPRSTNCSAMIAVGGRLLL